MHFFSYTHCHVIHAMLKIKPWWDLNPLPPPGNAFARAFAARDFYGWPASACKKVLSHGVTVPDERAPVPATRVTGAMEAMLLATRGRPETGGDESDRTGWLGGLRRRGDLRRACAGA